MTIEIGGQQIGSDSKPFLIAEAGVNFRDDLELGKAFVREAASSGADAVKFQTHLPAAEMVESEMRRLDLGDLYDRMGTYELSVTDHEELYDHCSDHDVTFLSTPFSGEAVDRLEALDVAAFKVGSGELTNHHLLDRIAATGKPLIVSTGMHEMSDVSAAHDLLENRGADHAFLYCVSEYPTAPEDFNFGVIDRMSREFDVPIGFSDHSTGVAAAAVAMARGATIVEKHFTIDRRLPGGDQEVSIEPAELESLADYATLVHETRSNRKEVSVDEASIARWARHSVVTRESIEEGEVLTEEKLTTKRPGTGISAAEYFEVIGASVTKDLPPDHVLQREDIA